MFQIGLRIKKGSQDIVAAKYARTKGLANNDNNLAVSFNFNDPKQQSQQSALPGDEIVEEGFSLHIDLFN